MKTYYGYLRVSTVKQGDGVSLQAQREAIEAYAEKHNLQIASWFEEKVTAAKQGRPLFNRMINELRSGKAEGVVVHKIDRSARNFRDWAQIGELIDGGVDVRFAHESLDLKTRGGRLTADIQAVIAADYVRNLREECLKGIEGRLKQGLFPFGAPIGYLDQGKGKPKIPDPERAPFVRRAFELYASGEHSIRSLLAELNRSGFRNKAGRPVTKGCLETMLRNPFYHGQIVIKRTGRSYQGVHQPLIERRLFDAVQSLKGDRQQKRCTRHNHTYRRCLICQTCGRSLVGELQKGRVYMRCQTSTCPTTCIREDRIEADLTCNLMAVRLKPEQVDQLRRKAERYISQRSTPDIAASNKLQLAHLDEKEERLTDALIDKLIDGETYHKRKERIEAERLDLERSMEEEASVPDYRASVAKFLELAESLYLHYQMADKVQKRQIALNAFSNRTANGKNLFLEPRKWLKEPDKTIDVLCGPPHQDRTRTIEMIETLLEVSTEKTTPPQE